MANLVCRDQDQPGATCDLCGDHWSVRFRRFGGADVSAIHAIHNVITLQFAPGGAPGVYTANRLFRVDVCTHCARRRPIADVVRHILGADPYDGAQPAHMAPSVAVPD